MSKKHYKKLARLLHEQRYCFASEFAFKHFTVELAYRLHEDNPDFKPAKFFAAIEKGC